VSGHEFTRAEAFKIQPGFSLCKIYSFRKKRLFPQAVPFQIKREKVLLSSRANGEQWLAVLYRLAVGYQFLHNLAGHV